MSLIGVTRAYRGEIRIMELREAVLYHDFLERSTAKVEFFYAQGMQDGYRQRSWTTANWCPGWPRYTRRPSTRWSKHGRRQRCPECGVTSYSANTDGPMPCPYCGRPVPPQKGRSVQYICLGADIEGDFFRHDAILLVRRGLPVEKVMGIVKASLSGKNRK